METVQVASTAASAPHRNAVRVVLILGARAPVCFVVVNFIQTHQDWATAAAAVVAVAAAAAAAAAAAVVVVVAVAPHLCIPQEGSGSLDL